MTKIVRVAKNEYLNVIRTKAFIVSIVLMPVFMFGAILVQKFLEDKVDTKNRKFAVVDDSGRLYESVARLAEARNKESFRDGKQIGPQFLPEESELGTAELSDRVRKGELFAYVRIPAGVFENNEEIAYHSQSPTYTELSSWLQESLGGVIREVRFDKAGLDQQLVNQLNRRPRVRSYGLAERTATGKVKAGKKVNKIQTFGIPAAAMFLLFMLVMTAAPLLLNNVLEEKMQRISEVLVSSVSPFELFLGKLVGMALVSWTLSILYLGGVSYLAHRFGFADAIPMSLYGWFLFFQLLALLLYGSVFSAFGAAASEIRDAQSMMMPAMLVLLIPMFVWLPVLKNPDSGFATVISLVPFATPFLMLLRVAVPPGPPLWELVAGVALSTLFTLGTVWVGSKIFRVGILAQGQTPSFRKLIGWVMSK